MVLDMTPDELLAGPRGRRLCYELSQLWVPKAGAPTGPTMAQLLAALDLTVANARYWEPPDDIDKQAASPAMLATLAPVAQWLAGSPPFTHWWFQAFDRTAQYLVIDPEHSPSGERRRRRTWNSPSGGRTQSKRSVGAYGRTGPWSFPANSGPPPPTG